MKFQQVDPIVGLAIMKAINARKQVESYDPLHAEGIVLGNAFDKAIALRKRLPATTLEDLPSPEELSDIAALFLVAAQLARVRMGNPPVVIGEDLAKSADLVPEPEREN